MPSGKVHFSHWKKGWVVEGVLIVLLLSFHHPFLALGSLIGYFLGQFITPDADLVGITFGEGRMLRKLPVIGGLFVGYWTIYGAVFRKHHRSFWTHSYIFSTVIRFVYGFWWIGLFRYTETWFLLSVLGMFIGLCLSDGLHVWADMRYGD